MFRMGHKKMLVLGGSKYHLGCQSCSKLNALTWSMPIETHLGLSMTALESLSPVAESPANTKSQLKELRIQGSRSLGSWRKGLSSLVKHNSLMPFAHSELYQESCQFPNRANNSWNCSGEN